MNIHATASNILATSSVKLETPPISGYCISGGDASINIGDLNFIQATKVTNISYTTSQVIHIQVAIYIYK